MSGSLAERLLASLPADVASADARARFAAAGLPSPKVESWRYSSLRGMESLDPAAGFVEAAATPTLAGISGTLATLISGRVSLGETLPQGVRVSVGAASGRDLQSQDRGVNPLPQTEEGRDVDPLPRLGGDRAAAFGWLNAAGASTGVAVDVHGAVSGIWRLALQHDANGLLQVRSRIHVHAGASITVLEHWTGSDAAVGLANSVLDIELDAGATLTLIRVQELGAKAQAVQRTEARCAGNADLSVVSLELGGLWSRHELAIALCGAQAQARVTGLVALQGRQHHDTQLSLAHTTAAATSRTLWKAVAQTRSRAVFNGLISVAPGADQTEAHLKTANLLLSAHAEIDTKPELVIEADEVVCSHGATVGQLDDKALFYLRSRGIPEAQARQMLTLAFGGEVLSAVADATLRGALSERIDAHLPQVAA